VNGVGLKALLDSGDSENFWGSSAVEKAGIKIVDKSNLKDNRPELAMELGPPPSLLYHHQWEL